MGEEMPDGVSEGGGLDGWGDVVMFFGLEACEFGCMCVVGECEFECYEI